MQGDWRVTVVVARESNDANNRSRRESLKAVARGGAAALMWPVTRSVEAFVKAVRMTERQGRRLRPTPHRRSTVLPRFDRGSLLVGALSPPHDAGMATPQVTEHRRWSSDYSDLRCRASSTEGDVYAGCVARPNPTSGSLALVELRSRALALAPQARRVPAAATAGSRGHRADPKGARRHHATKARRVRTG